MASRAARAWAMPFMVMMLALTVISCGDDRDRRSAILDTSAPTRATSDAAPTPTAQPAEKRGVDFGHIETAYQGSGPGVVILGDSITVSSREDLRRELDDYSVKIGALFGEGLGGGPFSAMAASGPPAMTVAATEYGKEDPGVAVLALGTNDAWKPELTLDMARTELDRIVAGLDGACLVAVTITEEATIDGYDRGEARAINDLLRARADQVVDWNAVGTTPEFTSDDEIHLDPAGRALRSSMIDDAVDTCMATHAE